MVAMSGHDAMTQGAGQHSRAACVGPAHDDPWRAALQQVHEAMRACSAFALRFLFPHWCALPFSRMHRESLARYDEMSRESWPERRGRRLVLVAPRGHAKSTLHSTLLPLLDLAFQRERFVMIVSATFAQAAARLRAIRRELESNGLLRELFPHLGRLEECNRSTLVAGGLRVSAFGAGSELRGLAHGVARPTKIVLDDVEDSARVLSARHREALADWYREVVEPLGDGATHIEVVGTMLHRQSLLAELGQAPHFEARHYRAVERWSAAEDLWVEWRRLLTRAEDPDRVARARAFFRAHRERMLAGTRVLWPERESYDALMEQFVALGRTAFFKEKQNEPPSAEGGCFHPQRWRYFCLGADGRLVEERESREGGEVAEGQGLAAGAPEGAAAQRHVADLFIVGFLDPSLGKGDWAAIATVGRSPDGVLYVLDVWLDRVAPAAQVEAAFRLHRRWRYRDFGYEAVGFQAMIAGAIEEQRRCQAGDPFADRFQGRPVVARGSKQSRIAALEPLIDAGWIRFARGLPAELFAQASAFPSGRYDDALDALAGAVELARRAAPCEAIVEVPRHRRVPSVATAAGYASSLRRRTVRVASQTSAEAPRATHNGQVR